jgi:hypothetical protein
VLHLDLEQEEKKDEGKQMTTKKKPVRRPRNDRKQT